MDKALRFASRIAFPRKLRFTLQSLFRLQGFISRHFMCAGVPLRPMGLAAVAHFAQFSKTGGNPSADLNVSSGPGASVRIGGKCSYPEGQMRKLRQLGFEFNSRGLLKTIPGSVKQRGAPWNTKSVEATRRRYVPCRGG